MGGTEAIAAPGRTPTQTAPATQRAEEEKETDLVKLATEALGKPKAGADVKRAVEKGLDARTIGEIWGLSDAQLRGLTPLKVVVSDGLNAEELKTIAEYRKVVRGYFMKIFGGLNIPEELFDDVWKLALEGKLNVNSWNKLMTSEKYKLKDFEMTGKAFKVLFNEEGFKNPNVVENIKELRQALYNLVLTIQKNLPRRGPEKDDAEQAKRYADIFKDYCKSTHFTVIHLDKFGRMIREILYHGKDGARLRALSDKQLFEKLKTSKIGGDYLHQIAELAKNWNEFLTMLLEKLEESIREGLDPRSDRVQIALSASRRLRFINDKLEKGEKSKYWSPLIKELSSILIRKYHGHEKVNWKTSFDYEKVRKGS